MQILIVDDEPLARSELQYLIERSSALAHQHVQLEQSASIKQALELLLQKKSEIIFLDISLNEECGFELAHQLQQLAYTPAIIFATAYDQYALEAFNVDAVDYILKPFEQARVDQALLKALAFLKLQLVATTTHSDLLSIELSDRSVVVKKQTIIAATVNNGNLTITVPQKSYQTKKTLHWLKQQLINYPQFMQVHRSALINLEEIVEVQPWFNQTVLLIMSNHLKIPVGRSYQAQLNQRLGL